MSIYQFTDQEYREMEMYGEDENDLLARRELMGAPPPPLRRRTPDSPDVHPFTEKEYREMEMYGEDENDILARRYLMDDEIPKQFCGECKAFIYETELIYLEEEDMSVCQNCRNDVYPYSS